MKLLHYFIIFSLLVSSSCLIICSSPTVCAQTLNIDEFQQIDSINTNYNATSIEWSPDGKIILAGLKNGTIVLYNVSSHEIIQQLQGHPRNILRMDWSPVNNRMISCSGDGLIIMWDMATYNVISTNNISYLPITVEWSPDAKYFAAINFLYTTVYIFDGVTGNSVINLTDHVSKVKCISWSNNGKYLAVGTQHTITFTHDMKIKIWNTATWAPYKVFYNHSIGVNWLDWSSDDKYLISSHEFSSYYFPISVWDVENETVIKNLSVNSWNVTEYYSISFSPDDSLVICTVDNISTPYICIWNFTDGTLIKSLSSHLYHIYGLKWSPDGRYIASVSLGIDTTIRIWGDGVPPSLLSMTCVGDNSYSQNAMFGPPDTGVIINFTASEYGEYQILIDTDGVSGFNKTTDRLFSGIATGEVQSITWDMKDKSGLRVVNGNYPVQIILTDTYENAFSDTSTIINVIWDSDEDGYYDNEDAFPNDVTEYIDTDNDGTGDNSDAFPDDPSEWQDTDGDGVGDNSDFAPGIPNNYIYLGIAGIVILLIILIFMAMKRRGRPPVIVQKDESEGIKSQWDSQGDYWGVGVEIIVIPLARLAGDVRGSVQVGLHHLQCFHNYSNCPMNGVQSNLKHRPCFCIDKHS